MHNHFNRGLFLEADELFARSVKLHGLVGCDLCSGVRGAVADEREEFLALAGRSTGSSGLLDKSPPLSPAVLD